MDARAIVDTGYLVGLLSRTDTHHAWAAGLVPTLRGPWLTAEACISETVFLLEQVGRVAVEKLFEWLEQDLLQSRAFLPHDVASLRAEMFRYRGRWVDLADACIVTLSDRHPGLPVVSVDARDFAVYFRKRPGRKLLLP